MSRIDAPLGGGSDPRRAGFELLGPVYAEFFTRLHAHMRPHDVGVKRLFVARAGVRLRRLYEVFCEARGLEPAQTEVLWASRLLATKALYGVDDDLFFTSLQREFRGQRIEQVADAFSRHGDSPVLGKLRKDPVDKLRRHLNKGRLSTLHEFFLAEAEVARAYLSTALSADQQVFLIDSGWHGTTHVLLKPTAPSPMTSLVFARVRRPDEVAPPGHELVGLIVESDAYDPARPESSITHHRHLVEAPLEPPSPSIERVVRDEAGGFRFPEAEHSDDIDHSSTSDLMFLGIEDYLRSHGNSSLVDTQAKYVAAVSELARTILHPVESEVHALDMGQRSSDFGRDHGAPVLIDPIDRHDHDRPDARIRDSLWAQGQAVLEFGDEAAAAVHRSLSGEQTDQDYFHPWRNASSRVDSGTVAVVTRTKDRPLLLKRAASSVATQKYTDYEWVVVNDGGGLTPVMEVIRLSGVRRSRITVVSNDRSVGMEAASNLGVRSVDSDFVTIHDDDDSWAPEFLATTVGFLQANGDGYQGVITHTTRVSEEIVRDEVITRAETPYNDWVKTLNIAEMSAGNLFPPIAFLFTRNVYDKCGGFPEDLPVLGDWDFNLRVLALADIGVVQRKLAYYHHRDVGNSFTYGNSVIAGRDKHLEYDARVRNAMMRGMGGEGAALGHLTLVGYTLNVLRSEIRNAGSRRHVQAQPPTPPTSRVHPLADPDVLWSAMYLLHTSPPGTSLVRRALNKARRRRLVSRQGWRTVLDLSRAPDLGGIPPAPDFDESAYLGEHKDVAKAVKAKGVPMASGWEHYLRYGRDEGRRRPGQRER